MQRILKISIRVGLALLILALLTGPLWAIVYISQLEQNRYTPQTVVQLQELSYGPVKQITRMDMRETVSLSGQVISTRYLYQELDIAESGQFRQEVKSGQVIQAGDVLGYYKGQPVLAEISGILVKISTGIDCYLCLESLEDLAVECYVDDQQLAILSRSALELTDSNGAAYQVLRIEPVAATRGTRVLLSCEDGDYAYGDSFSGKTFYTGREFPGALVISSKCVYQLEDGKYYLRLTDAQGVFLQELEVEPSYSNGEMVCISGEGIREGLYCDSGYKLVIESGGGNAGA